MTDQASAPSPERLPPWPMIIGVAVLGVFALILLALVLTRGPRNRVGHRHPDAVVRCRPVGIRAASTSASPSAAATASAGAPTQPDLAMDTVVATTVEDLTVRDAPGLDGERLGTLEGGALSFLAGEPTDADGFRWYLVSGLGLPPNTGCAVEPETESVQLPDLVRLGRRRQRVRRAVARRARPRVPRGAAHRREPRAREDRARASRLLRIRAVHVPRLVAGDPRRRRAWRSLHGRRTRRADGCSVRTSTTT